MSGRHGQRRSYTTQWDTIEAGSRATMDAPLARLQLEADGKPEGAAILLTLWPTGETREIGRSDFHGRWVKWVGWEI